MREPELSPQGLLQHEAVSSLGERPTKSLLPQKVQDSLLTDVGPVRENHFLPVVRSCRVGEETYGKQPTTQEDLFMAKAQSKKKPNSVLKGREI